MTFLDYQYDPALVSREVRDLLNILFKTSDARESSAEWVNCFAKDAIVWRNGTKSDGTAEIETMISNSWNNVEFRDHRPTSVFASGQGSTDYMIDGTTVYNWQDGTSTVGVWAARVYTARIEGDLKITDYHVVFVNCQPSDV